MDLFKEIATKASPKAQALFASILFRAADDSLRTVQHAPYYAGGDWKDQPCGKVSFLAYGSEEKQKETVLLLGEGNGSASVTNLRSACAAITVLALNHTLWALHEQGFADEAVALHHIWVAVNDAVRSDQTLDDEAIWQYLD